VGEEGESFGGMILRRHCEERSDEAIQLSCPVRQSWIASLRSQ
jgi:hypothetical protein